MRPWVSHELSRHKAFINIYIWCAVGAVMGLLVSAAIGKTDLTSRLEAIGVGMFGAGGGGEWLSAVFSSGYTETFSMFKLLLAMIGAAVLLALLVWMRKIVGPMRSGKSRIQDRP